MKKTLRVVPILTVIVLFFFVVVASPQPAYAASLTLTADTFASGERLEWARAGSRITVTVVDDTVNIATVTAGVVSDEADDELTLAPSDFTDQGSNTFTADFDLVLVGATSSIPSLEVDAKDDNVKVTYIAGNLARDFDLENEEPDINVITPDHEDKVDDTSVEFVVEVTDDESGVTDPDDMDNVRIVFLVSDVQCGEIALQFGTGSEGLLDVLDGTQTTMADLITDMELVDCDGNGNGVSVVTPDAGFDFDDIDDGQELTFDLFLKTAKTSFVGVAAMDDAGNFEIFNVDRTEDAETLIEITVDEVDPKIDSVRTGIKWDSADDEYEDDERDWLQVVFSDLTNLDGSTVDEDDFVVEGHTVRRVQWFDVDPEDVTDFEDFDGTDFVCTTIGTTTPVPDCDDDPADGDIDDGEEILHPLEGGDDINIFAFIARSVFIQLEDEMEPDETPDVNLVPDGVDDEAGNTQDNDEETNTDDKIPPGFRVDQIESPRGDKLIAGEDDEIELIISSDEELEDDPTVTVTLVLRGQANAVDQSDPLDGDNTDVEDSKAGGEIDADVRDIGINRWRVTIEEPGDTGYYNIFISGTDEENNIGTAGIDPLDLAEDDEFWKANGDLNEDDAIWFEGDIELPDPSVLIDGVSADGEEFEFRDPFFIEINFDLTADGEDVNEDGEYTEDTGDFIIITSFTLDGVDLTTQVSTTDNLKFLVAIDNIAIGDHEVEFQAIDEAGNELDDSVEVDFEVEEREAFEMEVNPGWNLISIPNNPADTDINSVFGAGSSVTTVYTFDPTVPGGWLVAVRESDDDTWVGDLTDITSDRGYWVLADEIVEVDIDFPRLSGGAVGGGTPVQPPTIQLFPGWNLVPVIDVTGDAEFEDTIDADDYFSCCDNEISRIQTFNTITNSWEQVPFDDDEQDDNDLVFGKAYWVFATEAKTLVP